MNKENSNKVFQCICGKQFDNKKSLHAHKGRCKIYKKSIKDFQLKEQQEKESRRLPNGMFKCEICGKEHDGSYGSGKFCCNHCRQINAAKHVKNRKSGFADNALKNRAPYGTWKCEWCNLIFETRAQLEKHNHEVHPVPKGQPWNKGLTKETDECVAKGCKAYSDGIKIGKIKIWCQGKQLPNEMKQKISCSMKKAHIEGRAHNIGECRWNNKPSYPEKWFMDVIENEFTNKEYIREFPFHKYSLDFAWVKLKKCIEIDGEQHYRDEVQMIRDKAKDKLLKEEGWKVLRLDWRWVYNNTKDAIKLAKEFIEC